VVPTITSRPDEEVRMKLHDRASEAATETTR
jgi:hypothetical protein